MQVFPQSQNGQQMTDNVQLQPQYHIIQQSDAQQQQQQNTIIPQQITIQQQIFPQQPVSNYITYTEEHINPLTGCLQQIQFRAIQHQVNLTDLAMQHFNIPDQLFFEHIFEKKNPCWSGRWAERSIFNVPGIGALILGDEYERNCRCYWTWVPQYSRRKQKLVDIRGGCLKTNSHYFNRWDYIMDNDLLELEYWNKLGIVTAAGIPIIKYQDSVPNLDDLFCGHCGTGYPKISLHFLLDQQKEPLLIIPEVSQCPETFVTTCPAFALCGVCQSVREFTVEGLKQGTCSIINTRTCTDACAKVCLCQGKCGCPNVDYPHFQVNFQNVQPVDKLAILIGLVHYNIIKQWYVMAIIQRRVVGLA